MAELFALIELNWPAAICLIAGFALVVVELFVPGFGVPGISGIVLLLIGVILATDSLVGALFMAILIVIVLCLLLSIFLRSASKGKLAKTPLVLSESTNKEEGYSSAGDMTYFIGREGIATSILRPAGTGDFDGVKLDVITEGEFLQKGAKIVITHVEGHRIVVREAQAPVSV